MDNLNQQHQYKKFLKDQLPTSELEELQEWLNSTSFDQYAEQVWHDFDHASFEVSKETQQEIYCQISKEINGEKISPINTKHYFSTNFSSLMKVAAVILFLILSTFVVRHFMMNIDDKVETIVMTPKGGRTKVLLPDGTEVWVNADSKISYQSNFDADQRILTLEGEALFKVVKNQKRPFIVKTGAYDVKVHGTSFKVSHYSNQLSRVDLVEGKVEVIGKDKFNRFLKPQESIIYDPHSQKFEMGKNQISEEFDQESTSITFQNESFQNILLQLERHYDVKFQVQNKRILARNFSGTFSKQEKLDYILDVMSSNNTFRYHRKENLFIID